MKRVFLIVLDSFGIGELPDAAQFGDKNCNTLASIARSKYFKVDNLMKMGLGNIDGVNLPKCENPTAALARLAEKSKGKDTTIGHWEIAGLVSETPMPTYPLGFPDEIINEFVRRTGRGVLCNKPYSGTEAIKDYGREHIKTGDLIVYTSADSVFQIAAHEDVIPIDLLYKYCRTAREILCGEHAVGRVIARPFTGEYPNFTRTANRHDYSVLPPRDTLLDAVSDAGMTVYAIGKINDIFAGKGITKTISTKSNEDGMERAKNALSEDFEGLCFINLVDFDSLYGHRQDVDGYAKAISQFDEWLPSFVAEMREGDMLIITADHGCDPSDESTDHSREYVPLIMYGIEPVNYGTRDSFADIAQTVAHYLGINFKGDGQVIK